MTLKVIVTDNLDGQPLILSEAAIRTLAAMVLEAVLRESVEEGASQEVGAARILELAGSLHN